ncbi:MAG: hypothetical protein JWL69_3910, partial [Phycisphaerales bacterium]|nr:hypothetical protein [Phycisphaerales bacterium]
MATLMMGATRVASSATPIPRSMRQKVEEILKESYAFMDSPIFEQKEIEKELFDF